MAKIWDITIIESIADFMRGRYFWRGDERFMIKGVVYQLHGSKPRDPLTDDRLDELERDIALFKELGLNTLFVYCIDNRRSHDAAMRMLHDAGISVLVGLSSSKLSTTAYTPALLDDYFATVDCMAAYPNTLGLIVANEVINSCQSTTAAPVIRAVARDVKKYMSAAFDATGQRRLPIGYSASSVRLVLKSTFEYLSAGDPDETIDFFCYHNFNWCGQSTMHISGYNSELDTFASSRIPVFFSSYGSNLGGPRIWQETTAIYSPTMTRIFSGGVAHEFFDGPSRYGLVRVEANSAVALADGCLTKLPDFYNLRTRLRDCTEPPSTEFSPPSAAGSPVTEFPSQTASWLAGSDVPRSAADWERALEKFEDARWVDVKRQLEEEIRENVMQVVMRMERPGGSLWRWRKAQATN